MNIFERGKPQPFEVGDTVTTDFYPNYQGGKRWQITSIEPARTHTQSGWWLSARSDKGWLLEADSEWFTLV